MQPTRIRIFSTMLLGLMTGVVASAAFLTVIFQFWESVVVPYPPRVTQTRRTIILLVEVCLYCGGGLIFGIVSSFFVPNKARDMQVVIGTGLAFIFLLPLVLIEGHLVAGMLLAALAVSAVCGVFIKLGQLIVFKFRKIEG